MANLLQDLGYAARLFRRAPAFTLVAVTTLALGIGANTAVFSVVNAVLLRPLPFERPQDLFAIAGTYRGERREFTSVADFADWRARSRVFVEMAATRGDGVSITTPEGPDYLPGAGVSEDFFQLLGVQPFLGRGFLPAEFRPGGEPVVILGHDLWLTRFGGRPGAVGMHVVLDGEPHTVVGVMPAGFAFPDEATVWRPLRLKAEAASRVDLVRVLGRVRPGAGADVAQAELDAIAGGRAERYPATNAGWGVEVVPLLAKSTAQVRRTLVALWAAVAFVLLIACANVGIMLLSRGVARGPEFAVRAALGAGRGRVAKQLLAEGLLLAALGGAASLFVAWAGVQALRVIGPAGVPRLEDTGLDWRVLMFSAVVSLSTGLAVGVLPAWRMMRSDVHGLLRRAGTTLPATRGQHRLMRSLAVVQVVVSLVLLVGAGLMVRTLDRLHAVDLGFDAERLLTFYVALPSAQYRDAGQDQAFFTDLLDRVRAVPGVEAASAVNALYVHWARAIVVPVRIEGRPAPEESQPADTHVRIVSPGFHRTLRVPVLRGRSFTERDGPAAPAVAVINETMARRYFGGQDPLGQRISVQNRGPDTPIWAEIVGVVGDVRQGGPDGVAAPEVQLPYTQSAIGQLALVVRTSAAPTAVVPRIRAQIEAMDPNLPLRFVQSMDDVLAASMAGRRFGARLLSAFGILAVLLTAVGLYGVVATTVGDRVREMAVRLALGATPARVRRMVVGQAMAVLLAGLAIGSPLAAALTRYLEPLLFGVTSFDPRTYVTTAAILAALALVGAGLPAYRASRVDPAALLRAD